MIPNERMNVTDSIRNANESNRYLRGIACSFFIARKQSVAEDGE
jgi:hypothetical protein